LRVLTDSSEEVKWLESLYRLFIIPDTVEPLAEFYFKLKFTSDFGVYLAQHGLFALHAAAFRNKGGLGILLVGASGSGKSTIAFSAFSGGYPYVSDENVLCRRDVDGIRLLPFVNQIGLRGDAPGKIFYDILEHHPQYTFCQIPADIVVFPRVTAGRVSTLESITDRRTVIHTLLQNIIWVNDKVLREQQAYLLEELSGLPAYSLLLGEDHKQRPQVAIGVLNGI